MRKSGYHRVALISTVSPAGFWWAAMPKTAWPVEEDAVDEILKNWKKPHGDRRRELVFIVARMDRAAIEASLEACLLTEVEMQLGEVIWARLPDPFPQWAPAAEIAAAG